MFPSRVKRRAFLQATGTGALAMSASGAAIAASQAEQPEEPFAPSTRAQTRATQGDKGYDSAKSIIASAQKIVTPNGIERLETVRIGGIEQWVSVRGRDRNNPVLLYIHGGPGYVSMPMSWWFAQGWDEYFSLVQWDQRGAGKTYEINDPAAIAPTMTLERMLDDTIEMTNWARHELGKTRIVALGHSFGTYAGLMMAHRRPDLLHAYVGVGQLTNGPESERRGWAVTMEAARRAGNAQAVAELQAIAPYYAPGHPPTLAHLYRERKWLDYYGGVMAYRHGNDAESDLSKLSPDYTNAEIAHIWRGNEYSEKFLLMPFLALDLGSAIRQLDCPLIVFAGRYDVDVNSELAKQWFYTVQAPSKTFAWFENSAHLPMTEEPGKFLLSLVNDVRPLAAG
jgi:pimeloyl-ACP methyl ester carboxylesterase